MIDTVLIAAGGTGGHIYPALAVAKALQQLEPGIQIRFVGTATGLETKLIPRDGYPLHLLSVGRLNSNVSILERTTTLLRLPFSFIQSLWLIIKFKPRFVLGVGGHASGPLLMMASLLRRRTIIWEPNAYPGLANRILSRFVKISLVVFKEASTRLKTRVVRVVGLPVRAEIEKLFQLPQEKPQSPLRILVFGGSQGARHVNTIVAETFKHSRWEGVVELVHQTGAGDFARVKALYGEQPKRIQIFEYLYDMDARLHHADLVISRAGISSLSDIAAAKKPSILVPLPTAADNHQQKNAEVFDQADAAHMVLQKDFTVERLTLDVEKFVKAPDRLTAMAQNVQKFFTPNAAISLARILLSD